MFVLSLSVFRNFPDETKKITGREAGQEKDIVDELSPSRRDNLNEFLSIYSVHRRIKTSRQFFFFLNESSMRQNVKMQLQVEYD